MSNSDPALPTLGGGLRAETVRGVEGCIRLGRDDAGCWWLLEPEGGAFFGRAVQGVRAASGPPGAACEVDAAARLHRWGFNAVGVGGDDTDRDDGLMFMAAVDFCRVGRPIIAPGTRLPDVFAREWRQLATERAEEVCTPLSGQRNLIGWVTDDAPGWAQPAPSGRPALLQICLSLEPGFAAYHAAWEFTLALHGGRLESLARAWGVPLANKEVVRALTRSERGIATRGYLRDDARWTREFARRYFTTTGAAVRAADPNHLVLGCRFAGPVGASVLAECVYPVVDAALPDWRELPAPGAGGGAPVLAGNVCWSHPEFWQGGARGGMLTSVERMLRRGRAALERAARHPSVVGYVWSQWQDEAGEQPPFARGLVHVNGAEAREHTELLTRFNARAEALRRAASRNLLP